MPAADRETAARINAVFERARVAEDAGQVDRAIALITGALDEPLVRREMFRDVHVWLAQLQWARGDHAAADSAARTARTGVDPFDGFRIDVLRATIACDAADLSNARELLASLGGNTTPLGAATVERRDEIAAWISRLRFANRSGADEAVARVDAALAIAKLWSATGFYRSAHTLINAVDSDLHAASESIDLDQVRLFQVELLLSAGDLDRARARAESLAFPALPIDRARLEIVRARIALASGRLADVLDRVASLTAIPAEHAAVFTAAAVLRTTVLVELNLLDTAEHTAAAAIAKLGGDASVVPFVALLQQQSDAAVARKHSTIALWELPFVPAELRADADEIARCDEHSAEPYGRTFTAVWTAAATAVLLALERGDLAMATRDLARLETQTTDVESDYVAARVRFVRTLVTFYGSSSADCVEAFLAIADTFHTTGARLAEAQVVRFAAWACARAKRYNEYLALATRASSILDEIGAELPNTARESYLLNKWNGRDELVSALVRALLGDDYGRPRTTTLRERCRTFREIDELTHWPIDRAFGDRDAGQIAPDAVPDRAMAWVREQLAAAAPRGSGRISLGSVLSLWWFPRRTLVLHYHVLPDRTYLFRIARRHLDVVQLPFGRIHLTANTQDLVERDEDLAALGADLGIVDALAQFPQIERLVIVPHDVISNVPFGAVRVGGRGLCEIVPVSQVDRLSQLRRRRARLRGGRFLSVGLSDYTGSRLRSLHNTEFEANAVVAALGFQDAPIVGTDATVESILGALPSAAVFHAAAHGSFEANNPAESGIYLRSRDGGYRTLTLQALSALDLRQLRLATMATCRSAQGASFPGRARICIPTAFLNAGARGVVASLWPVDDAASLDLMKSFYTALRKYPPSHALASLQRETPHPRRDWAGLVFYGSD